METIFVQIPAFRDEEIIPTVRDLFDKAEHAGNITVGICWQNRLDAGSGDLKTEEFGQNVRVLNKDISESEGVAWAKQHAQSLYQNEDYVLAIDSHSRFAKSWDTTLIDLLEQCPSSKAIISSSPHPYRLHSESLSEEIATFRCPSHFAGNGFLKLVSARFSTVPNPPLLAPFLVPRFMFSKAQFIQDVPADPFMYFSEEEITLSLRAWCAGWDVYHPGQVPIWHLYNANLKLRPLHWKENDNWQQYQQRSLDCYNAYVQNVDQYFSGPRSRFQLHTVRELTSFQHFAGVDLYRQQIFSDAAEGSFSRSLACYREDANKLWHKLPAGKAQPKKTPKKQIDERSGGRLSSSEGSDPVFVDHRSEPNYLTPKIGSNQPVQAIEPLNLGDQVPYFSLDDVNGKTCHVEIYAGQPLLLHVISESASAQYTQNFIQELANYNDRVKAWRKLCAFDRLCIFPGSLQAFEASGYAVLKARWCLDPQAELLKLLQAEKHVERNPGLLTYLLDPNLKLLDIVTSSNVLEHLQIPIQQFLSTPKELEIIAHHPPVMVIPDVINEALIQRLLNYWETGDQFKGAVGAGDKSKVRLSSKRRTDVSVMDKELSTAIDQAFAKNLFPELRKITGYDLKFRERYKLGCYFAEDGGKFNKHRDTGNVSLSFRRYAVSLLLNEGYGGGELVFPEYGNYGYKTKPGSAIVFPTPLLHQVQPVTRGQRFVLITFLFDEEQAAYRSCYRQYHQEIDDTADYRTTVDSHFSNLPTRSIYTRSVKEKWIDKQAFSLRTEEQPIEELKEPRLLDAPMGVMIIENYISQERCRLWRDYADAKLGSDLHVVDIDNSNAGKTSTMTSTGRVTEHIPLDDIKEEVTSEFVRIFASMLSKFYHVRFEWFEAPQMLRYGIGGLYNRHADSDHWVKEEQRWVRSLDRDYSVLLYLNEDFAGGELYFPRLDFRLAPKAGLLVAFPSNYLYEHAAEKTTGGMRYALVSWAVELGSPRIKEKAPYASVFLNKNANNLNTIIDT